MGSEVLYLSRADVERVGLPMEEIIAAVETVLVEKGEGRVEMPAKIGIHPMADAYLRAAPAYLHSLAVAGVKWVSKFNENSSKGLPTISGLLILNDSGTGLPLAIMDCTWITAKRTGAASAVAAKYLARRDAAHLTIIGCGVQGRSHLEAMLVQFPDIRRIVAYDQRPATLARYVREMQATHGVPLEAATDCASAVRDADIIVTATEILKQPKPVIRPEWIKEGAFCMPIDFDAQFTPEAIRAMDLFYTDDTPQMESYRGIGYFAGVPRAQGDLGDLVTGKKPARTTAAQRTMSMQLGLAIEDMVTAIRIYERARAEDMGTRLPL